MLHISGITLYNNQASPVKRSIKSKLTVLNWFDVKQNVYIQTMIFVFKIFIFKNVLPNYLHNQLTPVAIICTSNTRNAASLNFFAKNTIKCTKIYKKLFFPSCFSFQISSARHKRKSISRNFLDKNKRHSSLVQIFLIRRNKIDYFNWTSRNIYRVQFWFSWWQLHWSTFTNPFFHLKVGSRKLLNWRLLCCSAPSCSQNNRQQRYLEVKTFASCPNAFYQIRQFFWSVEIESIP